MLVLAPILTLILGAWLVLMVVFPRTWATLLDREYDFLVRKGLLSQSLSDRARRIEKGGAIPLGGEPAVRGVPVRQHIASGARPLAGR